VEIALVDGLTTRELRRSVLRPSWPVGSVMHGDDAADAVHLAALDEGELVGACLVFPRPYPLHPDEPAAWQLRGMAISPDRQQQGIGGRLLEASFSEIAARGGRLFWCDARTSAVPFYERHGLVPEGDEFAQPETGIPHYKMWRRLDP
jgi:predicted GNAT family N-acyltransferase